MNPKAGETRSVLRRQYLLHTPDAFVRTPMPCVTGGVTIVHASPRLGADFLQYTAELESGGVLQSTELQRFVWVLGGQLHLPPLAGSIRMTLGPSEFLYLPPGFRGALTTDVSTRLIVIEKKYQALEGVPAPQPFSGCEADIEALPLAGDAALTVKSLLPAGLAFDCAVNVMCYAPGASLAQIEIHHMEHGLVMLEGSGTYRLGDDLHVVHAGDCIWMAPYCPQWFIAGPKGTARYLIYKDWNRTPAP